MKINIDKLSFSEMKELREQLNTKLSYTGYMENPEYKKILADCKSETFELPVTLVLTINREIDGDDIIVRPEAVLKSAKNARIAGISISNFYVDCDDIEYNYSVALAKKTQKLQERLTKFFDSQEQDVYF
jgi:hypothetical protein